MKPQRDLLCPRLSADDAKCRAAAVDAGGRSTDTGSIVGRRFGTSKPGSADPLSSLTAGDQAYFNNLDETGCKSRSIRRACPKHRSAQAGSEGGVGRG